MKQIFFSTLFLIGVIKTFSQTATDVNIHDTRSINLPPLSYSWLPGHAGIYMRTRFDFKIRDVIGVPGSGYYSTLMTMPQWGDGSGGKMHQLNFNNGGIFYRQGEPNSTSWENWQKLVIENGNGNVGIGTTTPSSKFSIQNNGANDNIIMNFQVTNGSNAATFRTSDAGNIFGIHSQNSGDLYIKDTYDNALFYGKNGGNVGIGTTSPVSKLHVNGDITVASGNRIVYDPVYDVHGYTKYDYVGMPESALLTYSYYGNRFQTRNGVAMVIRGDNNNVGIGTTNPGSYKLAVEGTIGAWKLKVTQTTWADEVFKPTFKLKPLQEVEQFILKHHHLPDIPSEKLVIGKDIDVGDTQALLLKKIEELTLYIIAQQKTVQGLREEHNKMKVENRQIKLRLNRLVK